MLRICHIDLLAALHELRECGLSLEMVSLGKEWMTVDGTISLGVSLQSEN